MSVIRTAENLPRSPFSIGTAIDFFKSSTLAGRAVQLIAGVACLSAGYYLVRWVVQKIFQKADPHIPPKDGSSPLSTLPYDPLFEIYKNLDAESVYSCSRTCHALDAPLTDPMRIKLIIQRYIPRWIEDCAKEKWRSEKQKAKVSAIFKILTLFPHQVIFPDPRAPTIRLLQKMFQLFEIKIRNKFNSDPLWDKISAIYYKVYTLNKLNAWKDTNPKLRSFLYNVPTVWLIGHTNVTSVQAISRRHDQRLLTDEDKKTLGNTYAKGVGNYGFPFVLGSSKGFFNAVLTTFSIRHGNDDSNVFFVDYNLVSAFIELFQRDEQDFRQKFSLLLDFYDYHMQRGNSIAFQSGEEDTLMNILYILACPLSKTPSKPLASALVYFVDQKTTRPLRFRENVKDWVERIKSFLAAAKTPALSARYNHQNEESTGILFKTRPDLDTEIVQVEKLTKVVVDLQDEIDRLSCPTPPVFASLVEFIVNFENEPYFYDLSQELTKHAEYFKPLHQFVEKDTLTLQLPEGSINQYVHLALQYLQGNEISIDEKNWWGLLQASEFLQIPRLSLICQRTAIILFLEDKLEFDEEAIAYLPKYLREAIEILSRT